MIFGKNKKPPPEELSVWMDPIEFSQLCAVLETLAPRHVLEWGCGGSTKAVLERSPFIERYVSVEHVGDWYAKVKAQVTDPRLSLHHVPADQPLSPGSHSHETIVAWDARAEAEPAVMKSYVEFPASLGLSFDFVLVDGRARRFCLAKGFELLRSGGVIVLHDAQREQYHDALRALGRAVFLEPYKQGQIALVHKE